jgi:hypothetical protein
MRILKKWYQHWDQFVIKHVTQQDYYRMGKQGVGFGLFLIVVNVTLLIYHFHHLHDVRVIAWIILALCGFFTGGCGLVMCYKVHRLWRNLGRLHENKFP